MCRCFRSRVHIFPTSSPPSLTVLVLRSAVLSQARLYEILRSRNSEDFLFEIQRRLQKSLEEIKQRQKSRFLGGSKKKRLMLVFGMACDGSKWWAKAVSDLQLSMAHCLFLMSQR